MRWAGTAVVCVLAAFGAAFLVGRALEHPGSARAAGRPATAAPAPGPVTPTTTNAELASQFVPGLTGLKPRPRRHAPHHRARHRASPPEVAPASSTPTPVTPPASTQTQPTPVTPAPVYQAPASSGSTSAGGGSTHKKRSGGSGTTTIG